MKYNYGSSAFSSGFVTVVLLMILSFYNTLGETNVNQQKSDNITAEQLISRTSPTLVGIYNDLNEIFKDDAEAMIAMKRSVGINDNTNISASETQNDYKNSSNEDIQLSDSNNGYHNGSNVITKTFDVNLCKNIEFGTNITDHNCLPKRAHSSAYYNGVQNVNFPKVIPEVIYIPIEGDNFEDKSYIGMMAQICSEPGGKVLIIDGGSNQQLLSFNNEGTTKQCNYYPKDEVYENFISDSHTVTLEIIYPTDEYLGNEIRRDIKPGSISIDMTLKDVFSLKIIYFEIKFTKNEQISFNVGIANETEAIYIPNSVITYKLENHLSFEETKRIGVQIKLEKLDIDIDLGDFLLIGPGSQPTHRELSKAQIIAQKIDKEEDVKNIWVNADSAYLRLVTHNSDKRGTALKFSWKPPNNTYDEIDDTKVSSRIRNSAIQICVSGHSCQNMRVNFQNSFIAELIHIANEYLVKQDHETTSLVSRESVVLFNQEDGIRINDDKSEIFCQLSLALTSAFDPEWPMVSYSTLHHIFFDGKSYRKMHSFGDVKVNDCSHPAVASWKMILPIVIILIVSVLLMLIAWRYQYNQWMRSQRLEAKYMKTQINDTNEDTLFTNSNTKNPVFIDVVAPTPERRTSSIPKTTDFTDGNFIINNENIYVKQLPKPVETSTASQNQAMANNTTNLEDLWISPSTSQHSSNQNLPQYNDHSQNQTIDVNIISDEITRDIPNIADRSHSTSSDTIPIRINEPITGLHGTQHESLRSYPRSVLRRPRTASENEYVIGPESSSLRFSKVQFELPKRSPLLNRDSIGNTSSYENNAFVNDC